MIDEKTLNRINKLIEQDKVRFTLHAEMDILKQGHNWSKEFLKECLRKGKKYTGKELYPDDKDKHKKYYVIHKPHLLSSALILMAFLILQDLLIVHIQPANKGSKEGKIYYNL